MKLFKTPQAINLWKIFSFLILFMVIDTVTAFFGLGIVLILKYFKLVSIFNAPTLILLELIIRYGLAFIIRNHHNFNLYFYGEPWNFKIRC